jgi:hypothetical protein
LLKYGALVGPWLELFGFTTFSTVGSYVHQTCSLSICPKCFELVGKEMQHSELLPKLDGRPFSDLDKPDEYLLSYNSNYFGSIN